MQRLVLIGLFLFAVPAVSQAGDATFFDWEMKVIQKGSDAARMDPSPQDCFDLGAPKISCTQLSDGFCQKLWGAPNEGNFDFGESKFRLGKSPKSGMAMTRRIDLDAWLDAEPRFPEDLRKKTGPILTRMRKHLKREEDTKVWHRELGNIEAELSDAIGEVGDERARKQVPELMKIKAVDLTVEQNGKLKSIGYDLKNEILRAKYESHPNWKRVLRIFEEVRADMSNVVSKMPLSKEARDFVLNRISTIRFTLPYDDPRLIADMGAACRTDQVNAFYVSEYHAFTVCAGYFNAYQSDSQIYEVIAHEVAHSFDPARVSLERMRTSQAGKITEKLCKASGPVFSCEEWKRIRQTTLAPLSSIAEPDLPFRAVTSCLKSEDGLEPFDYADLVRVSKEEAAEMIRVESKAGNFFRLASPTVQGEDGKEKPNELYMRPDRLRASWYNGIPQPFGCLNGKVLPEIFMQELECQGYRQAQGADRIATFKKAVKETEAVAAAIQQNIYASCGKDCPELVDREISRHTREEFADWMMTKAMTQRFARQGSVKLRREDAVAARSVRCPKIVPTQGIADLREAERERSFDPYQLDRLRQLRYFTPEVAKLLQCEPDFEKRKDALCDF